ncbi:LysR family transcriptional regulator [Poseidonocella sp. HB161398]|uniref:LysR family transcriptional regulator n=1 Tax=Poseidonocella sp. HB161398 TaxID=2320855 RepID=UPI0011083D9A|nr:LysR family transcriptional regulator [Poseidonocella sp. HB161398]
MNFKQLEAFYWLTRLQSFQAVADRIGLTQPAVSARIGGLEEEFGVKLIDRDAARFCLTGPGHEVAEFAERFMNMREAMVARLAQKHRSRFAIGMVGPAALTWGAVLRRELGRADPDLVADFHVGSNMELLAQVSAGALDMAFVTGEAGIEQVPGSFAVRYEVGWVARPDVAAGGKPLTPEELRALPLVLYPPTSPLHSPVADYIEETRDRAAPRHFGYSMSTIVEMLRQGFGATALPLAVLEKEIAQGFLAELPVTVPLAPFEVRCIHLTGARRKLAGQVFALAERAARDWCAAHPRYARFIGQE